MKDESFSVWLQYSPCYYNIMIITAHEKCTLKAREKQQCRNMFHPPGTHGKFSSFRKI